MSEHGAALQTYNQELVKCLEQLKIRRREFQELINQEENDQTILETNIKSLQQKLNVVNTSLTNHRRLRDNYEKTITDIEDGFKKIVESSQTLLNLAQHEAQKIINNNTKGLHCD